MESVRPKPGYRREKRLEKTTGILYLRCYGTFHDGEWLPWHSFGKNARGYYTLCRECRAYKQAKSRGYESQVKLNLVRKWLWEVINRCGSINNAARTMGITKPTIYRWLGRYKGYEQKRISRKSVKLILQTLADLRSGKIKPAKVSRTGNRKFKYGCSACGGPIDELTPGCANCEDRIRRRESRKLEK